MRNCFAKGGIAAPRSYSTKGVPQIEDADARLDKRVQSRGEVQRIEVLRQTPSKRVAEVRAAMPIDDPLKQILKLAQQTGTE